MSYKSMREELVWGQGKCSGGGANQWEKCSGGHLAEMDSWFLVGERVESDSIYFGVLTEESWNYR